MIPALTFVWIFLMTDLSIGIPAESTPYRNQSACELSAKIAMRSHPSRVVSAFGDGEFCYPVPVICGDFERREKE